MDRSGKDGVCCVVLCGDRVQKWVLMEEAQKLVGVSEALATEGVTA